MATNRRVVVGGSVTALQLSDLMRQIGEGKFHTYHMQALLEHRNPFGEDVLPSLEFGDWKNVYEILGVNASFLRFMDNGNNRKIFNKKVDSRKGLWVMPVVEGVSCLSVIHAYASSVRTSLCVDNIDNIDTNRDSKKGSYIICFQKSLMPDSLSNVNSEFGWITILERLLLGFGFFVKTGMHLDVGTCTCCCGSINLIKGEQKMPYVNYTEEAKQMNIDWSSYYEMPSRMVHDILLPIN